MKNAYLWAVIERLGPQAVTFVVSVVIARMVEPAAYGLVAMLGIFMALGSAFSELGFSAALIQKESISPDDETSVFCLNIAAGILVTLALCATSPLVAAFFRQDILVPLLCTQSLSILITSFGIVQSALISRGMEFRLNALIESSASISSGALGIAMAWLGYGVWSLVGLNLSRALVTAILLWKLHNWRPRGRFSLPRVRAMWSYNSKLLYASLLHRVATNLHSVAIGRLFAPGALGIYARANSFQQLPVGILAGVVQRVAFPLFSRHQGDLPFLLTAIRQKNRIIILASTTLLTGLCITAPQLIPLLLGSAWNDCIPLLQILCLGGVFSSIFPLHSQMVMALGQSNIFFCMEVLKKLSILLVVLAFSRFGLTALAWGSVLISITDYALSAYPNAKLIGYRCSMHIADVLPALVLCCIAGGVTIAVTALLSISPLLMLAVKLLFLLCSIMGGVGLLRRTTFADVWAIVRPVLRYWHVSRIAESTIANTPSGK